MYTAWLYRIPNVRRYISNHHYKHQRKCYNRIHICIVYLGIHLDFMIL